MIYFWFDDIVSGGKNYCPFSLNKEVTDSQAMRTEEVMMLMFLMLMMMMVTASTDLVLYWTLTVIRMTWLRKIS